MEVISDGALSVASLKNLVDMEDFFIGELTNYAIDLKEKITLIESFLKEVQVKREISKKNPEEFVLHPLNGYSLIRRLHEDWSYIEAYMSSVVGASYLENMKNILDTNHVTEKDMKNAINGILSIQLHYNLENTDIARGFLLGRQYNASLNTLECMVMADYATHTGQEQSSINWHNAALQQYNELEHGQEFREVFNFTLPILYISYVNCLLVKGLRRASIDLLRGVSDSDVRLWQLHRDLERVFMAYGPDAIYIPPPLNSVQLSCLGQSKQSNTGKSEQKCFYERRRTAFLTIAPLKTEILNLDPYIAIFHDVIYESEIKRVKNTSLSLFKSPSPNHQKYNVQFAKVYEDQESMLNKRIKDLTGDEVVKEDKDFDVYNYGLGGFSHSHLDIPNEEDKKSGLGNFLTSVMFFLSDLDQGGAINFINKDLTVLPKKGSALVWRNLNNSLNFDIRLFHFSCPVIMGSKWTLVKWLHEVPQIFTRPCRNNSIEFNA
ncbi:hypothetical protein KR074_010749 [Drosophila pseudoananassae]|nr:hypothetical protein KR074_010749 [Drosophila pseudoananassae]